MSDITLHIADETAAQVEAVLDGRSLDEFAEEALRRQVLRDRAAGRLLAEVIDAEASGLYLGTLEELAAEVDRVIEKAAPDQREA